MKPIEKDELFGHLTGFLKARGIELKDGSYAQSIQKGCSILADTINLSQQGIERAQTEIEKRLDQMRQAIHEKTAPKIEKRLDQMRQMIHEKTAPKKEAKTTANGAAKPSAPKAKASRSKKKKTRK